MPPHDLGTRPVLIATSDQPSGGLKPAITDIPATVFPQPLCSALMIRMIRAIRTCFFIIWLRKIAKIYLYVNYKKYTKNIYTSNPSVTGVFIPLWQRGIKGDFKIMLIKSPLAIRQAHGREPCRTAPPCPPGQRPYGPETKEGNSPLL